jgi:hypothetical protein
MPPATRPNICQFLRTKLLQEVAALKTKRQALRYQLELIEKLKEEPIPDRAAIKAAETRARVLEQEIAMDEMTLATLRQDIAENCRPAPPRSRPGARPTGRDQ